jgi:hypothetical protein
MQIHARNTLENSRVEGPLLGASRDRVALDPADIAEPSAGPLDLPAYLGFGRAGEFGSLLKDAVN